MEFKTFPRTVVGGVSLPRMLMGTNWMAGWSHTSDAADRMIKEKHSSTATLVPMMEEFVVNGVDAIMGLFDQTPHVVNSIYETREKLGHDIIMIDTPILNMDDNATARQEARQMIRRSRELGATFCLIHHSSAEQLVNKNTRTLDRLPDYLAMIREEGLIPGLSAHMPELITYSDDNEYDVETYIQLYNCLGFLMQVEVETVNQIIHAAKHPVMTIKPMAAGRTTPFVGLNFSWATLRDCDMVTVGCYNEREVAEDIEISRAALERRTVNLVKRDSPNRNQAAFGKR